MLRVRIKLLYLPSDHKRDYLVGCNSIDVTAADYSSIPQDRYLICNPLDLFDEVRNIDNRFTLFLKQTYNLEQPLDVLLCQAAGWLIQNQHIAADSQGPCNLHQLL